jgi:hypothetical protein
MGWTSMIALSKSLLVILIGIYAIRSSWFIFSGIFSPLTPIAAIVLVLCVIAFHTPPSSIGPWFFTLLATFAVGAVANFLLLFASGEASADPVNRAFSLVSMLCFLALGAILAKRVLWV